MPHSSVVISNIEKKIETDVNDYIKDYFQLNYDNYKDIY